MTDPQINYTFARALHYIMGTVTSDVPGGDYYRVRGELKDIIDEFEEINEVE